MCGLLDGLGAKLDLGGGGVLLAEVDKLEREKVGIKITTMGE